MTLEELQTKIDTLMTSDPMVCLLKSVYDKFYTSIQSGITSIVKVSPKQLEILTYGAIYCLFHKQYQVKKSFNISLISTLCDVSESYVRKVLNTIGLTSGLFSIDKASKYCPFNKSKTLSLGSKFHVFMKQYIKARSIEITEKEGAYSAQRLVKILFKSKLYKGKSFKEILCYSIAVLKRLGIKEIPYDLEDALFTVFSKRVNGKRKTGGYLEQAKTFCRNLTVAIERAF